MKKVIFFILINTILWSGYIFSQPTGRKFGEPWRKELQAEKIAFITTSLDLTPAEAQVFWPVYNERQKKEDAVLEARRNIIINMRLNLDKLSEKEISRLSDQFVTTNLDEAKLSQEYHEKYKKILSAKKVMLLYQAEMQFKNKLLNRLGKNQRQGQGNKNGK
jgi:hypothetical protein